MYRPFLSIPWESSQQPHIDIMTQQGHCAQCSHLQRMSAYGETSAAGCWVLTPRQILVAELFHFLSIEKYWIAISDSRQGC